MIIDAKAYMMGMDARRMIQKYSLWPSGTWTTWVYRVDDEAIEMVTGADELLAVHDMASGVDACSIVCNTFGRSFIEMGVQVGCTCILQDGCLTFGDTLRVIGIDQCPQWTCGPGARFTPAHFYTLHMINQQLAQMVRERLGAEQDAVMRLFSDDGQPAQECSFDALGATGQFLYPLLQSLVCDEPERRLQLCEQALADLEQGPFLLEGVLATLAWAQHYYPLGLDNDQMQLRLMKTSTSGDRMERLKLGYIIQGRLGQLGEELMGCIFSGRMGPAVVALKQLLYLHHDQKTLNFLTGASFVLRCLVLVLDMREKKQMENARDTVVTGLSALKNGMDAGGGMRGTDTSR